MKIVNNYTLLLIQIAFISWLLGTFLPFEENFQKFLYLDIFDRRHNMYNTIITTFWNLLKWKSVCVCTQLCLTFGDIMHCSPPGSPVHGIFQAKILDWVAISYSRGSSKPEIKPMSLVSPVLADSLPLYHLGSQSESLAQGKSDDFLQNFSRIFFEEDGKIY